MTRFYLLLWLKWVVRVSICSVLMAILISVVITLSLYVLQGLPSLSSEVVNALFDISKFWFPIVWGLTLLVSLFRSLKYIFNSCINRYELKLLKCNTQEIIEVIGYGDLVKVWRKWLMLMIWLVGVQMILAIVFTNLFTDYSGVFEWFDIYFLFFEIIVSGYFSFIILAGRCKQIRVVKC